MNYMIYCTHIFVLECFVLHNINLLHILRNIYTHTKVVNKQLIKLNNVAVHEHGTGPGRLWLDHKVLICLYKKNPLTNTRISLCKLTITI